MDKRKCKNAACRKRLDGENPRRRYCSERCKKAAANRRFYVNNRREILRREKFIQTWNNSASVDEVCSRLGMSRGVVYVYCTLYRRQGFDLKRYRAAPLDYPEFAEVWNAATSVTEVARHFGISNQQATGTASYLRRANVALKKFVSSSTVDEFVAAWNSSATTDEACAILGISKLSAQNRATKLRSEGHYLKKRKGGRVKMSDEQIAEFVAVWNAATSVMEVAQHFGIRPGTASLYATRFRKRHNLKKFPTASRK